MDVPFESFADLIYRLSHPPKPKCKETGLPTALTPSVILTSWLNHHRPHPPLFGKQLFRLLYPHEGSRRRYGLKETKLSRELQCILGLRGLARWDGVSYDGQSGTGCLGREVECLMRDRLPTGQKSSLTIREIDHLLDQLATLSPFSQLSQPGPSHLTQSSLLTRLFRDSGLSPYALAVLTQVILRDLRPLLNPLPRLRTRNPTAMVRLKSNTGPAQLELAEAMRCWDHRMIKLYYGGKGDLDWCADAVEDMRTSMGIKRMAAGPQIGVNVQIPKCRKGRSVDDALKPFFESRQGPSRTVWAETKYDGYRMQIHVHRMPDGQIDIRIFSKSKRDSTLDRINTHAIIRSALGLPADMRCPAHPVLASRASSAAPPKQPMRESVILEAEVVPYNEASREGGRGPGIEEFWQLGSAGVSPSGDGVVSAPADRSRHLCLVFFDILYLDGDNLLETRYDDRRRLLEGMIRPISGFSMLASRVCIPLWKGLIVAKNILEGVFRESSEAREEGLVLKAAESTYLDPQYPWVKLKKDYIPNLGDCIDLVVLGAGWDIDRARELRVDTSVFTTFYIGVLTNRDKVQAKRETPHFEILFRASYGMDRGQLEVYNENIRLGRWRSKPFDKDDPLKRRLLGLSWTYHIPRSMSQPSVLFEQPLCAEIMGAGFQRLPFSNYYELRWPRLQKIFAPDERKWTEALGGQELIATARQALGYQLTADILPTTPRSPEDDSIRAAWRSSSGICLDVPDSSGSPSDPRATRRMQSAPVFDILKRSPLTPTPSSPNRDRAIAGPSTPMTSAGRRMQAALLGQDEGAADEESLPLFVRTPTSSPAKRAPLASPLHVSGAKSMPKLLTTSPLRPAHTVPMALSPSKRPVGKAEGDNQKRKKRKLRPLSLRSRLKLAARQAVPACRSV